MDLSSIAGLGLLGARALTNPTAARLAGAGLNVGGAASASITNSPTVNIYQQNSSVAAAKDWRVRISLPSNFHVGAEKVSPAQTGTDYIQLLKDRTNGVVFPYLPSITVTHNARYQEQSLTHSNYKNYFYEGSDVAAINISGEFTVQSMDDGQYLLAVIYFLRSVTKMFFGNDPQAGNPPPTVFLDGYGDFYFPHVSCVVTSFQHIMPDNVDYVEIPQFLGSTAVRNTSTGSNNLVRLPTASTISVTVQPVYSRTNVYNNWNWQKFSSGQLLGNSNSGTDQAGFL